MSGGADKPVDPNDPTFLSVQKKLRRLMLVAGGTLGIGIIAVFGAILYRITTMDATPAAVPVTPGTGAVPTLSTSALGLPADAKLISTAMDGTRLALTYDVGGSTETIVVDTRTNTVVNILRMSP